MEKFHYDEDIFLEYLSKHINSTYDGHYSGKIQPTEFILSHASSMDFLLGNVIKYVFRYGKKNGYDRSDLMKACHYLMMMDYYSKTKFKDNNQK